MCTLTGFGIIKMNGIVGRIEARNPIYKSYTELTLL